MTTILVTGYKNTDLGIFQDKDPKIQIIKKAIRRQLLRYLDNGVEWFILTGNLGFEYWFLEEALTLKKDYDFSIGTIFCFENQGEHWNATNQEKLSQFKNLDFVKYCYSNYQNPSQFINYNQFLIENTDEVFLFYSQEHETSLKYLNEKFKSSEDYPVTRLDFEMLNDIVQEEQD